MASRENELVALNQTTSTGINAATEVVGSKSVNITAFPLSPRATCLVASWHVRRLEIGSCASLSKISPHHIVAEIEVA